MRYIFVMFDEWWRFCYDAFVGATLVFVLIFFLFFLSSTRKKTDAKLYDGLMDCAVKTVKQDGFLSLWRGFVPIWARFAPQATLQLLTLETLYVQFGFKSI